MTDQPKTKVEIVRVNLKQVQDKLENQIREGHLCINQICDHLDYSPPEISQSDLNADPKLKNKIGALKSDLAYLNEQLSIKRKKQRQADEELKKEAASVVNRLKKQKRSKSEYIKLNESLIKQSQKRLEELVKKHREFQRNQIVENKQALSARIQANKSRKNERERSMIDGQIEYWSKIQAIESNKRHNSLNNLLPPISEKKIKPKNSHFTLNANSLVIPRKNSDAILKKKVLEDKVEYKDIVHRFLERAKFMQEQSRVREGQSNAGETGNPEKNPEKAETYKKMPVFYNYSANRGKILGNQYLKDSLVHIDKSPKVQETPIDNETTFIIESERKPLNKNKYEADLEERREKILINLLEQKLNKETANEQIREIDKHLDKINPEGIQERLRVKLDCLEAIKSRKVEKPDTFFLSQQEQ